VLALENVKLTRAKFGCQTDRLALENVKLTRAKFGCQTDRLLGARWRMNHPHNEKENKTNKEAKSAHKIDLFSTVCK
jgi:hypothetical protein